MLPKVKDLGAAICLLVLSWLMHTLFLMFAAWFVYFSVLSVSMKSQSDGDMHTIITVRLEMSQVCHYSGDTDFCTTGFCKYKAIPIIQ